MNKRIIRKIDDKSILVDKTTISAACYAEYNEHTGKLLVKEMSNGTAILCDDLSNILIAASPDGEAVAYGSPIEAIVALNSFIGSFTKATASSGSGSVSPVVKEQLLWDREVVAFGAGDSTLSVALKVRTVTEVSEELVSGKTVVVSTPTLVPNKETKSKLIVATGATIGTLQLPTNVVWSGDTAPNMGINTIYRIVFEVKEDVVFAKTI